MKIIFLDIDGVLNSYQYDCERQCNDGNIDKTRLELLKELVVRTDAKIVLTSTWRTHRDPRGEKTDAIGKELEEIFTAIGLRLFDRTPLLHNERALEISTWLAQHPDVEAYVIFDDIKFGWGSLEPHVVKTDYRIGRGLNASHIQRAINILMNVE